MWILIYVCRCMYVCMYIYIYICGFLIYVWININKYIYIPHLWVKHTYSKHIYIYIYNYIYKLPEKILAGDCR